MHAHLNDLELVHQVEDVAHLNDLELVHQVEDVVVPHVAFLIVHLHTGGRARVRACESTCASVRVHVCTPCVCNGHNSHT